MSTSGGKLFDMLSFEARLPLQLSPVDDLPDSVERSAMDERNQQLLDGLAVLDRVPATAGDDSADVSRDLARMENKLDLLLLMLSTRLIQLESLPLAQDVVISAGGFTSLTDNDAVADALYRVRIFANPTLAVAFEWWVRAVSIDDGRLAFRFIDCSEPLQDALVRWVFRHHRRQVAGRGDSE